MSDAVAPEVQKPQVNKVNRWTLSTQDVLGYIQEFKARYSDDNVSPKTLVPQVEQNYKIEFVAKPKIWNQEKADYIETEKKYEIGEYAMSQYLAKLGIPIGFYNKCPDLIDQQLLNHFNSIKRGHFQFRCIDGNKVRGILSDEFTTAFDNDKIFPGILAKVDELEAKLGHVYIDHEFIRLECWFSDSVVEYEGLRITGGVSICNSEVGKSCLWFDPVIKVENIWSSPPSTVSEEVAFGHYSVFTGRTSGSDDKAGSVGFIHKSWRTPGENGILNAFNRAKQASQVGMIQYMEAIGIEVNTKEAIAELKKINSIPKRLVRMVEEELANEQKVAKDELIKKILAQAKDLPIIQQLTVQQGCSEYLGVFDNVQARMAKLSEELGD